MANILPSNARKEIWSFYRNRFLLVGSSAALIGAFLAFLAILPAYVVIRVPGFSVDSAEGVAEIESTRAELIRTQSLVTQLSPVLSDTESAFRAVAESLQARPRGIYIQSIDVTTKNSGTIIIRGSASERERISDYRDALIDNERFTNVSVPVGDLAGAEGGQFSITLTEVF